MSKIGRRPIDISGITVEVKNHNVQYKGAKNAGTYHVGKNFTAHVANNKLTLAPTQEARKSMKLRELNCEWGLHRALLANELKGAKAEFEKIVEINGLGYKAAQSGNKLVFTLGYSHKIDFPLEKGISVVIDKTGQNLTIKSSDKQMLGLVCDRICDLRRPEPYKGTGIKLSDEYIVRKAGKTK